MLLMSVATIRVQTIWTAVGATGKTLETDCFLVV